MAKQLIINAIEPREVRAAILEDGEPSHFFIERSKRKFQKGNIYRARVTSIEPHLQAAFVELDKGQHGFLGISDIILPDAGVSIINGLPAPIEEKKLAPVAVVPPLVQAEIEDFDDDIIELPKIGPKLTPVELSPVAGDMLLGLESELLSPIREIVVTEEPLATEPLLPEPASQESVAPVAEIAAETERIAAESETLALAPDQVPTQERFGDGEEVDTAIFSIAGESENDLDEPVSTKFDEQHDFELENEISESQNDESIDLDENDPVDSKSESGQRDNRNRFKHKNHRNKPHPAAAYKRRPNMKIEDVLEVGQYIAVQIIKEGIGNKAPMVSTYLSLAGHYMVLTPGGDRSGVSRQVRGNAERVRLKNFIDQNDIPERCGLIVRTAAEDIPENDLKADIQNLAKTWEELQQSFKKLNRSGVIKQEEALASRLVRDYYQQDIEEVWIDDPNTFKDIKAIFDRGMSDQANRLHLFDQNASIFYHFKVEAAIKGLFNRKVNLPGGGSLIFDQNEAMLVIDINSGTFKEGEDDEDTAFKLNMLACKEIARQVQMRDVGGIVMIDFVDMRRLSSRSKVEKELERCFKGDKARINIMHIGALGVLQMSRQRTRDSLRANLYSSCPHCDGTGLTPSKTHSVMSILREIRGNIKRFKGSALKVRTTAEIAMELLNNYKRELSKMEESEGALIQIDIDPKISIGEFSIDTKNQTRKEPESVQKTQPDSESFNSKKKRKRNKRKDFDTPKATEVETKTAISMTSRLELMEKQFPSANLGIIRAPNPDTEKAAPEVASVETTRKDPSQTDVETKPMLPVLNSESEQQTPLLSDQTKHTSATPNKDQDQSSTGVSSKAEQDSDDKSQAKTKAKSSVKKKAAFKKKRVQKTSSNPDDTAASKSEPKDSPK